MGNNRLVIPEARAAMKQLKKDVMKDSLQESALSPIQEPIGQGETTTYEAGKRGGAIGGEMMKRLVSLAEQHLQQEQQSRKNQ